MNTTIALDAPPVQASASDATVRSGHYPGLDGLRGLAILAVLCSHFSGGHTSGYRTMRWFAALLDTGWVGVDLFFALSGFLITGILLDTAETQNRATNFYVRRALRIFPAFYGVLFVLLLLTPVMHLEWHAQHLLYFLYLSNMLSLFTTHPLPIGPRIDLLHLWSLAVEEQFYLLWPAVVWLVRDRRLLLRIALLGMAGALLLRVALVLHGVADTILYQLLPTRADGLLAGAVLALYVRRSLLSRASVAPFFLVSGIGVIATFLIGESTGHATRTMSTVGYSFLAVFCTCLVAHACREEGLIRSLTTLPMLRFFGRYSYGLYLYHGLLLVLLTPLLPPFQRVTHSTMLGGVLYVLVAISISTAAAVLSYEYFERPILRLKRHFV